MFHAGRPEFRKTLKRTTSHGNSYSRHGSLGRMPTNEDTPLLNGNGDRRHSTFALLFAKDSTPGEDSEALFVRWPARGFTITKITLLSNYVNILLVFVPLGIISGAMDWSPIAVFILNFFAIIPLAAVLSFATEEISMKLGETMGGLLNATFGNAVELIVCVILAYDMMIC
jgi:Ca2+:H+ antiporter